MTIYQKMILPLIGIVAIPTILLGFLAFQRSSGQIESIARTLLLDNLQHNIQRLGEELDAIVGNSEAVIGSVKLRYLLAGPPPQTLSDELRFMSAIYPLISELKGDYELFIYPTEPERYPNYTGKTVTADTPWYAQAIERGGLAAWQVQSPSGGPIPQELILTRSIRNIPYLETLGVLRIRVPAFVLADNILAPQHLARMNFMLIDEAGELLLTSADAWSERLSDQLALPDFGRSREQIRIVTLAGEPYYEASLPIGDNGWRLAATIPVADLMGPVDNIKTFMWWLVASGIVVMILFAMLLVRQFTTPIKSLVHHMRRIHRGKLDEYPDSGKRADEIGQLMHGYNSMVAGMRQLIDNTKQIEKEKHTLEIRSLIQQINPHFLYNTMETIRWRAEKASETTIAEMVSSLANLLRFSINNGEELTTVEREIEHVRSYLQIEMKRAGESFQALFHVHPNIMHYPFMKLTIQPLVENAVRHAMKQLPAGTGKIMIAVLLREDQLVCTVEDNGPGSRVSLHEHFLKVERAEGGLLEGGVGLYNVNRRMELRFGSRYGLYMENRSEGGCRVTLLHPAMEHTATDRPDVKSAMGKDK